MVKTSQFDAQSAILILVKCQKTVISEKGESPENQEFELLQAIKQARSAPIQLVYRAQVMLHSSERVKPARIACEVGLRVGRVREWIKRFNRSTV